MKRFEGLKRSEIKKAEALANKINGVNDCKVTAYSTSGVDEIGFITVDCEICRNYEEVAEYGVTLNIFMDDRRRSWASVIARDYAELKEKGIVTSIRG